MIYTVKGQSCWVIENSGLSNMCWRNCGEKGYFRHIRWTCPVIREYWDAIRNQISKTVGYLLPSDPLVILLGLFITLSSARSCSAIEISLNLMKSLETT
uniref:Uncharacterized protein n=1 Tax=Chelonoidis abingdonii TaxID=106734 RepID=A0A8C0GEP0_CHEAB